VRTRSEEAGVQSYEPANEGPNSEQGKGSACSTSAMNPSGGAVGRRAAGIPDPNEYLLERLLSRPNMSLAWRKVKANRGAPGWTTCPPTTSGLCSWTLAGDLFVHLCRNLQTSAGQKSGDPESNRGEQSPRNSRCS
jgi:hypothetical protein